MNKPLLDLYSDYLVSSFSLTTATGLSAALDGEVSHDKITRFLSEEDLTSKDLWKLVKPVVRKIESEEGVLIFDDTTEEKPYTDENDIIAWHFDHVTGRSVKGINMLSCLYHANGMNVPVAFEVTKKTKKMTDPKTGKTVRKSDKNKNEVMRAQLKACAHDLRIKFSFVLADSWFSSSETMAYIKKDLKKDFVMPLKSNRLITIKGVACRVDSLGLKEDEPVQGYAEGVSFPLLLMKHVFTNEDGTSGILFLASSDTTRDATFLLDLYGKRWSIEEYHKSLKSNLGFSKSPTKTVRTQINHFFASLYAYVKLEKLKMKTGLNHFALKAKLYLKALRSSMDELARLKRVRA
jgi:IS4 transposase